MCVYAGQARVCMPLDYDVFVYRNWITMLNMIFAAAAVAAALLSNTHAQMMGQSVWLYRLKAIWPPLFTRRGTFSKMTSNFWWFYVRNLTQMNRLACCSARASINKLTFLRLNSVQPPIDFDSHYIYSSFSELWIRWIQSISLIASSHLHELGLTKSCHWCVCTTNYSFHFRIVGWLANAIRATVADSIHCWATAAIQVCLAISVCYYVCWLNNEQAWRILLSISIILLVGPHVERHGIADNRSGAYVLFLQWILTNYIYLIVDNLLWDFIGWRWPALIGAIEPLRMR